MLLFFAILCLAVFCFLFGGRFGAYSQAVADADYMRHLEEENEALFNMLRDADYDAAMDFDFDLDLDIERVKQYV